MIKQLFLLLIVTFIFTTVLKIFMNRKNNVNLYLMENFGSENKHLLLQNRTAKSERWIVITTISKPTDDIKEMSAFKDWTIVVVADKKTPNNWSFPNCHFLSVEDQMMLGYEFVSLIPFNSYTRKMIGYLYAIENGAKFIYDTDDDNLPIKSKLDSFDYSNVSSSLVYKNQGKSSFFNVYAHFGRPDIWPRGFPLEVINEEVQGTHFHLCSEIPTSTIQQGLVNQDADVDAVYRMIYIRNKTTGLKVKFDDVAPPVVIDEYTYVPFNSQNTLFHYGAFWALMLPTSVAFRVTDIWRGYFAQRLLHLSGQTLTFFGPNARQNRNLHNYYTDYIDETFLYTQSSKMINMLRNWTCQSTKFVDCVLSLSKRMVSENLWLHKDYQLTNAWLKDLQNIGYTFPNVQSQQLNSDNCSNAGFVSNIKKSTQPFQTQMNSLKTLNEFCQTYVHNELSLSGFRDSIFNHTKNVVLVVVFNFPHFGSIPLLQTIYDPWFANVIYCGSFPDGFKFEPFKDMNIPSQLKYSYVNISTSDMGGGYFGYLCLTKVAEMGMKNVDGFLVLGDDVLLNFWNPFNLSTVHSHTSCAVETVGWWASAFGEAALKKMQSTLNYTFMNRHDLKSELEKILLMPIKCSSDIYYVPQDMMQDYSSVSQLFFEHKVFLELAVPKILAVLGWSETYMKIFNQLKVEDLTGKYLWGGERDNPLNFFNKSSILLHPFKFSQLNQPVFRSTFCNVYVASLFKAISTRT